MTHRGPCQLWTFCDPVRVDLAAHHGQPARQPGQGYRTKPPSLRVALAAIAFPRNFAAASHLANAFPQPSDFKVAAGHCSGTNPTWNSWKCFKPQFAPYLLTLALHRLAVEKSWLYGNAGELAWARAGREPAPQLRLQGAGLASATLGKGQPHCPLSLTGI